MRLAVYAAVGLSEHWSERRRPALGMVRMFVAGTSRRSMLSRASGDNARLSLMGKRIKSDEETAGAVVRLIRGVGRRAATADPDQSYYFRMIRAALDDAQEHAVQGWREQGFSDAQIGRELGITRQAVRQRWPRVAA